MYTITHTNTHFEWNQATQEKGRKKAQRNFCVDLGRKQSKQNAEETNLYKDKYNVKRKESIKRRNA